MTSPISKVLVVDDDQSVADTIALVLIKRGFDTVAAYDAQTALRLVANDIPDCAIVDVLLPDMRGIDLAVQIRERSPHTQILLLTGDPNAADEVSGREFEVLAKPVEPEELITRMLDMSVSTPAKNG